MARFENKQKIDCITMYKTLHNFCPLGQDWYTNRIRIEFEPNKTIPDYIEIDSALNELESKGLVIEDVVDKIVEIFVEYEPFSIKVVSKVDDATHLPVEVMKEWWNENV